MVDLVVKNLVRSQGGTSAVDHLSPEVADGEFVSLLRLSGCGKSTTLADIAGLDRLVPSFCATAGVCSRR